MASFTALNGGERKMAAEKPTPDRTVSEERSVGQASAQGQNPFCALSPRSRGQPPGPLAVHPDVINPKKRKLLSTWPPVDGPETSEGRPSSYVHFATEPSELPRDVYGVGQGGKDHSPYGHDGREQNGSWPAEVQNDGGRPCESGSNAEYVRLSTDEHIVDDVFPQHSPTSPDGGDAEEGPDGPETYEGSGQVGAKKRKRNFIHRTKTGCFSCRRRRKKCTEEKPNCLNCVRGGFECLGYPESCQDRASDKSTIVPLESKDPSYVPPGAYGMPQQQASHHSDRKRLHVPPLRGYPLRIDLPLVRSVMADDDRSAASTSVTMSMMSPGHNKLAAISAHTNPTGVFPAPVSAISSTTSHFRERIELPRLGHSHDAVRGTGAETARPGTTTTLPHINILNPTSSPITQPQPQPQPHPQSSNPQLGRFGPGQGHFALTQRQPTQKELMLKGQTFQPYDQELVLERERCSAACWRFNNSSNPSHGVSVAERSRLFREILVPTEPVNMTPSTPTHSQPLGQIGSEVVVEAPFTCDYGYNISIGDGVLIGRNCSILDPCPVTIGSNTCMGPNVSLFTVTLHVDPARRRGCRSEQIGSPIGIEADVFIGGGATILPGCKIGRGSTVGAGSVVTKDVPPFTVVAGNPARVKRQSVYQANQVHG